MPGLGAILVLRDVLGNRDAGGEQYLRVDDGEGLPADGGPETRHLAGVGSGIFCRNK
jgi:hypothetical protein